MVILISPATHQSTRSALSFYQFEERLIVAEGSGIYSMSLCVDRDLNKKENMWRQLSKFVWIPLTLFHVFIQYSECTPTHSLASWEETKSLKEGGVLEVIPLLLVRARWECRQKTTCSKIKNIYSCQNNKTLLLALKIIDCHIFDTGFWEQCYWLVTIGWWRHDIWTSM